MHISAKDLDVKFTQASSDRVKAELRGLSEATRRANNGVRARERFREAISRAIVDRQLKAVADSLEGIDDTEATEYVNIVRMKAKCQR